MPIHQEEAERKAILDVAGLMLASARTAPKARGIDGISTLILSEKKEIEALADEMGNLKHLGAFFERDAKNLRNSQVVVLIGVKGTRSKGLNCGACGFRNCQDFEKAPKKDGNAYTGPNCIFFSIDLGIALGSAVKIASQMGIDNRIMFTIGTAAKRLGILDADVILGIPLSATGKNPYFDRG
ncbi:hypothetical protein KEJ19_02340 [Candidatus Bathyarchaeota archaeon]|nr:hypothetical protein [Candidatus Bathyarchaeota archaeon]